MSSVWIQETTEQARPTPPPLSCGDLEQNRPHNMIVKDLYLTERRTELHDVSTVYNIQLVFVLQSRAKQLYNAGYKTLTHLANADPAVLSKTIENLYKKQADQIVASAKVSVHLSAARQLTSGSLTSVSVFQMLLNEKAAVLQEEVDDLLMVPLDLPAPLKTQQLT